MRAQRNWSTGRRPARPRSFPSPSTTSARRGCHRCGYRPGATWFQSAAAAHLHRHRAVDVLDPVAQLPLAVEAPAPQGAARFDAAGVVPARSQHQPLVARCGAMPGATRLPPITYRRRAVPGRRRPRRRPRSRPSRARSRGAAMSPSQQAGALGAADKHRTNTAISLAGHWYLQYGAPSLPGCHAHSDCSGGSSARGVIPAGADGVPAFAAGYRARYQSIGKGAVADLSLAALAPSTGLCGCCQRVRRPCWHRGRWLRSAGWWFPSQGSVMHPTSL